MTNGGGIIKKIIRVLTVLLAGCDTPKVSLDLKGLSNIPAQTAQLTQPKFQIVMHPTGPEEYTFLLDTETGAAWQRPRFTNYSGDPVVWMIEDVVKFPLTGSGTSPRDWEKWTSLMKPKYSTK
jgi:hypothetical protein